MTINDNINFIKNFSILFIMYEDSIIFNLGVEKDSTFSRVLFYDISIYMNIFIL